MKSISASIIVLAGAMLIGFGSLRNSDIQGFTAMIGCIVGLIGLISWFITFKDFNEKP